MIFKLLCCFFICFAAFFLIFAVRGALQGYRLVRETSHPKRAAQVNLSDIPYKTRRFRFSSCDGLSLSAIQYFPLEKPRGTILACHYLGGSKTSIYPYIEPLLRAGFSVAAFDYPNHGESGDRRGIRYTLEDDMRRFIRRLKAFNAPGPYGAIGFSMGATVAFRAADEIPELRAVAVDSGPMIFVRDYFNYVLQNKRVKGFWAKKVFLFLYLHVVGFSGMQKRTTACLRRHRRCPALLIHSKSDRIIPYRDALFTYSLLSPETARLVTVEKAHHLTNRIVLGNVYDALVVEFFSKWLK